MAVVRLDRGGCSEDSTLPKLDYLVLRPDDRLVELGCGPSWFTRLILARFGPGGGGGGDARGGDDGRWVPNHRSAYHECPSDMLTVENMVMFYDDFRESL